MAAHPTSQQLSSAHLVLCAGTVTGATFEQLVNAARVGEFHAVSLFPSQYRMAREAGRSDADLRALLADNGLCIAELDPLLNWVPGHEFPTQTDMGVVAEDEFYRIADAIGGRSLNVVWAVPQHVSEQLLAESFAAVCDRAAHHGLLVHIEFVPWAQVNSIETAARIVRMADRRNGGILFDSWHHFRSGADDSLLGATGASVSAIQLNDAPAKAEPDAVAETMQRRLWPGAGDIPLVDAIRRLDAAGCAAPLGIEIFSTALQRQPFEEIGRLAGENLRALRARARGG